MSACLSTSPSLWRRGMTVFGSRRARRVPRIGWGGGGGCGGGRDAVGLGGGGATRRPPCDGGAPSLRESVRIAHDGGAKLRVAFNTNTQSGEIPDLLRRMETLVGYGADGGIMTDVGAIAV